MSDPSVNVTETVVTETYYPSEPDIIEVPVPDTDVVEETVEDLRMAEDERFTAMDGKIDALGSTLTSIADTQSKITELLAKHESPESAPEKPAEKEDKPETEKESLPEPAPQPNDDAPEAAEPGMPIPPAAEVIENAAPSNAPGVSSGKASTDSSADKTPRQKLGWRRYVLGGSGGRLS